MREIEHDGASVGAYEAKTHLGELLSRVHDGEEITITRHGLPVARLVPVRSGAMPQDRARAIERWIELSQHISLDGLTVRDLLDEGRE